MMSCGSSHPLLGLPQNIVVIPCPWKGIYTSKSQNPEIKTNKDFWASIHSTLLQSCTLFVQTYCLAYRILYPFSSPSFLYCLHFQFPFTGFYFSFPILFDNGLIFLSYKDKYTHSMWHPLFLNKNKVFASTYCN